MERLCDCRLDFSSGRKRPPAPVADAERPALVCTHQVADPLAGLRCRKAFSRDPSLSALGSRAFSRATSQRGSHLPAPIQPDQGEASTRAPRTAPTIRIGVVGTGAICEVVVTGLCLENAGDLAITVSPRNAARAAALAAKYPDQVKLLVDGGLEAPCSNFTGRP